MKRIPYNASDSEIFPRIAKLPRMELLMEQE